MPDGQETSNGGGNSAVLTREFVPQEFHDRPYLKDLLDKPWDKERGAEVFKKLDGAESLLGKRPTIPDPKTAKPEDLDKFFAQFAEEKPEGYEIPLEKDAKVDPDFVKAIQAGFHAGKISKVQAQNMLKVVNEWAVKSRQAAAQAKAKADAEFDTLAKTMLGQENKATMERVKNLIAEHAPSVAKASIAKLDDNNLLIMAAVIDGIYKKYASEDEIKAGAGSGSGATGAGGVTEKREKAKALMVEITKLKPMDPKVDELQKQVNQLYREIAEATA